MTRLKSASGNSNDRTISATVSIGDTVILRDTFGADITSTYSGLSILFSSVVDYSHFYIGIATKTTITYRCYIANSEERTSLYQEILKINYD